ncbi:25-hydroxycholesterol 7-alpha-hydroxylase 1 [Paraphaeosphaeria minitans]|uniref:25-hydroxycholesterol 7-alpha-hydroxylase 1 n=1 Tax=Paraphaeosphaeria minitans TaxID=565426 RepID=A0A9P6G7I1_9PLEO|nr:25-hydroxycholesterol 7-alpha-hydroxylase 1 [Paraphaeosphaeria minitans]
MYTVLHATQSKRRYGLPIHTLRMPFQRIYVINAPQLIQVVQNKSNLATFVPTLLDFGMLFSGLSRRSKDTLTKAYGSHGNGFTKSVHKHLASGSDLHAATRTAVEKLTVGIRYSFVDQEQVGLYETLRHQLCQALTGAIYGAENPHDDPAVEASWLEFVPGISHLLYSPFPWLTAHKALKERARVIKAFQNYFETGGHTQAFAMIPEMFNTNANHGLPSSEAAKLEMATSLAMLSSGAISAFWLMFHIASDPDALRACREELLNLVVKEADTKSGKVKVVDLSNIKTQYSTLTAMWHETLRYHSTVINIKKVQHDTTLASEYFLKKGAIVMIPGSIVHHNTNTWGPSASDFDHKRSFTPAGRRNLSNTTAYRPFGAGTTMCPGRHFSTSVVLSLVAMTLLQFDVQPVEGQWQMPTKTNADMWNAMPKPVRISRRVDEESTHTEWKFVWGDASGKKE